MARCFLVHGRRSVPAQIQRLGRDDRQQAPDRGLVQDAGRFTENQETSGERGRRICVHEKAPHRRSGSVLSKVSMSRRACFEASQTFLGSMTSRSGKPSSTLSYPCFLVPLALLNFLAALSRESSILALEIPSISPLTGGGRWSVFRPTSKYFTTASLSAMNQASMHWTIRWAWSSSAVTGLFHWSPLFSFR